MRILCAIFRLPVVIGVLAVALQPAMLGAQTYTKESGPEPFTYEELVQLGLPDPMSPQLAEKLREVTTTPFINNEAYYRARSRGRLTFPGWGRACALRSGT
jgi:hypothetical protein